MFSFIITVIFDIKITPFSVNCFKYEYGSVSFYTLASDEKKEAEVDQGHQEDTGVGCWDGSVG